MEINKTNQVKDVSFKGYQHKKSETGSKAFHVNCMYDANKYDCEFQCFRVGKDKKGNYFVEKGANGSMEPFYTVAVPKEGVMVEPEYDMDLSEKEPFAYRFALRNKNTNEIEYLREDDCEPNGCSIVTRMGTTPVIQGPVYQAMVDTFNPGYVFAGFEADNTGEIIELSDKDKENVAKDIRGTVRTFSNTSGGTMAGLVVKLNELHQSGIRRLSLTPLRGGDKSSHKYWINNDFIMAGGIGSINDYNTLIRESFKNDMNLVDDMAVTSEGLQGIHYQRAIKWMDTEEKPPEYYYFRMSGLQDGALGLGVVPKNCKNINHKMVNSPFEYKEFIDKKGNIQYKEIENKKYNPNQPTYLQIFDDTMVSDKQRTDTTSVIKRYEKNAENKLGINTHDDTTFPYTFEINPYEFRKNITNLNEINQYRNEDIKLNTAQGTLFVGKLSGISIEGKNEGGFVCWDSNTDMPKRNYFTSNYDTDLLSEIKDPVKRKMELDKYRQGNYEVQDIAISAARHLVRHVRNVQNEYVAKKLGNISSNPIKAYNRIHGILNTQNPEKPVLPEGVRLERNIIENVLEDNYELRQKEANYDVALTSALMDLPLDSLEFAQDTQGALSSPYLSKRSYDEDHLKETRYEAMIDKTYNVPKEYAKTYNKMNEIFTNDVKNFADKVLQEVNKNSAEPLFDDKELTEYGQYVIPLVAEDIAKYAVAKALMPELGAKILQNGEIAYDYNKMEEGSLRKLGINGDSQKDEANQIVNKIKSGVRALKSKDVDFVAASINKRIENTNTNSFKFAEVMVDRGGYGVDLRFDAAKDVADMDAVRNGAQTFDKAWSNCKKFWNNIMDVVNKENSNTASFAEFTDLPGSRYVDDFLRETGVSSEANYDYFFDGVTNLFGYDFTKPSGAKYNSDSERSERLEAVLNGFAQRPTEYKRNSYVFASNHDKPRIIHCLSLDMELFHSDLSNKDDITHRKTAFMIINDKMDLNEGDWNIIKNDENYFNNVSSKAVANGSLLRDSIGKVNQKLKEKELSEVDKTNASWDEKNNKKEQINQKYNAIYSAMSKSIADVVNGRYYRNHPEILDDNPRQFMGYQPINGRDDLKVVNEKDGFGSKAIPDAFDIVYDQAVTKYGMDKFDKKDLLNYRNSVDSLATEVGRAKTRIVMRYLGALTGNPTIYAGDELGMTGYEEKCKNAFLQNRTPLDWSVVDENSENKREDIITYRDAIMGIMENRKADDMNRMEALNNGVMHKLNPIDAGNGRKCSAIISEASNGVVNISLFNPSGISQDPKTPESQIHPTDVSISKIPLYGIKGKISLTTGTEFSNILDRDGSVYKVVADGDGYAIKKFNGRQEVKIDLNDNNAPDGVMMLYHLPDNIKSERETLVQKKSRARRLYNAIHNIPSDAAYKDTTKPDEKKGKNVDITSKE